MAAGRRFGGGGLRDFVFNSSFDFNFYALKLSAILERFGFS